MNKSQITSFLIFTVILSASIYSLFSPDNNIKVLKQHFKNCNYDQAIQTADIIIKDPNTKKNDRTKAYIIKGISEFSTNQVLNSRLTFLDLLILDQNIRLNSKEVSPKIIVFFNELKHNFDVNNFFEN